MFPPMAKSQFSEAIFFAISFPYHVSSKTDFAPLKS